MAKSDPVFERVKAICLSLPDTKLTMTWGSPHFRVGEKIFAGYGNDAGKRHSGFKLELAHAAELVASDPRFSRAPYVGHKGWVQMDLSGVNDWDEVRALIVESYRLIAPKRTAAKLTDTGAEAARAPRTKRAARRPVKLKAPPARARATQASRARSSKRAP